MVKQFFKDLKQEFAGYNSAKLMKDVMAGLTVCAVALPLALAFGVSSGASAASGLVTAIIAGVIIALDKQSGKVVWHKEMDAYCYSSPVAVYDEAGKGWIIQACANGTLYLLDGLTGENIDIAKDL